MDLLLKVKEIVRLGKKICILPILLVSLVSFVTLTSLDLAYDVNLCGKTNVDTAVQIEENVLENLTVIW